MDYHCYYYCYYQNFLLVLFPFPFPSCLDFTNNNVIEFIFPIQIDFIEGITLVVIIIDVHSKQN